MKRRLRERIRDVKTDQRKRGLHLGGHRPFGYRVDADRRLAPAPKKKAALARMKELRRSGPAAPLRVRCTATLA